MADLAVMSIAVVRVQSRIRPSCPFGGKRVAVMGMKESVDGRALGAMAKRSVCYAMRVSLC